MLGFWKLGFWKLGFWKRPLLGTLLFWFALALPSAVFPENDPTRRFVESQEEFDLHTQLHILRVAYLAEQLVRAFPEKFGQIDIKLLQGYILQCHDRPKWDRSPEFLQHHGITTRRETIGESLWNRLYGRSVHSNVDPMLDRERQRIVDLLNHIERKDSDEYLERLNLPPTIYRLFKVIEKIADLVDRQMCPVTLEEMGRLRPIEEFLEADWLPYARNLMEKYHNVELAANYLALKNQLTKVPRTVRRTACHMYLRSVEVIRSLNSSLPFNSSVTMNAMGGAF